MGYFQVRYDSRVVIYERKMFIRLATVNMALVIMTTLLKDRSFKLPLVNLKSYNVIKIIVCYFLVITTRNLH